MSSDRVRETRCVGVAVFVLQGTDDSAQVLLMRRAGGGFVGEWCPVAGKREHAETLIATARRETLEETGLELRDLAPTQIRVLHGATGDPPSGHIEIFVARAAPNQSVSLNYEHSEFLWVSIEEGRSLVSLEGQRQVLGEIERVFLQGGHGRSLVVEPPGRVDPPRE